MQTSMFSSEVNYIGKKRGSEAFSLLELLVVIAIIALLTAILFPVFSSAQESSRESSTITHMQQIQSGLALYKLDNGQYPQVLFGYAAPNPNGGFYPMSDSTDIAQTSLTYGSLYPTYVNDYHAFESQDNPVDNNTSETVTLDSTELGPIAGCTPSATNACTQLNIVARTFYVMDGMDVSPQLAPVSNDNEFVSGNNPSQFKYVLRYQRDWMNVHPLVSSGTTPTASEIVDDSSTYYNYLDQLRWHNPPADSYVTSVTYHVPAADKVLVLFDSGTVKKMTPRQYRNPSNALNYPGYDDSQSCFNSVNPASGSSPTETCSLVDPDGSTQDPNGDNPAQFWKIANSQ